MLVALATFALALVSDVDRFAPADGNAFLVADDARPTSSAFALVSWAKDPLVLRDAAGAVVKAVIGQQLTSTVGASFALDRLTLSLQAAGFVDAADQGVALAFASPRAAVKLSLVDTQGLVLAVRGAAFGPSDRALAGLAVEPAVLAGFHNNVVSAGLDVGVRVGSSLSVPWAAAVEVPFGDVVSVVADLYGSVAPKHTPMEAALAARARLGAIGVVAGVGGGLVADVGTPALRAFAGVSFALDGKRGHSDATALTTSVAGPGVPAQGEVDDAEVDALLSVADHAPSARDANEGEHAVVEGVAIAGGKIELGDDIVLFDVDSAALLPSAHAVLAEVAGVLAQHPEIAHVVIEGHADALGGSAHNQKLSHWRAWVVRHTLVNAGVSASRLSITAFGASLPVASNDTSLGRRKNRRVELRIDSVASHVDVDAAGGAP